MYELIGLIAIVLIVGIYGIFKWLKNVIEEQIWIKKLEKELRNE